MKKKNIKIILGSILSFIILINIPLMNYAKFNMSYLYGGYDYISLVERTNGTLNEVSPSYFDLNTDGSLKLNSIDSNLVNFLHFKGMSICPFLSNHWSRSKGRNALSNREALSNEIANAINKYNLDGVNVDLENLTEEDRENYTDLIRLLREKLPNSKSVSVAVAANPYAWNTGWQSSYDYKNLATYSDYIMLMTYDEHYEGGPAGPVASIDFVEKSIQYALQYVPSDKIVLGIPFFGRYWKDGASSGGYGVSNVKIDEITNKYTSTINYDNNSESVKATVIIKNGEKGPTINGKTLTEGTYTFWYENEQSITKKLELVNKYNLMGSGSWSLGQETADTWNYYKNIVGDNTLNETDNIFVDVPNTYWAYDSVCYAKNNNWIAGKSKNEFEPESFLTRAEFAVMLCRVLGYDISDNKDIYADTSNHWAKASINALSKANIINGYGNGIFKPDSPVSREEVVKVLSLLTVKDVIISNIGYRDVLDTRWSYSYIQKMSALGFINGYGNNEFRPENPMKRSEIVTILYRMFA